MPAETEKTLLTEEARLLASGSLRIVGSLLAEGLYSGSSRSLHLEAAREFADYRPYVPGDDLRSLDWRAWARTDRDYVRLARRETDRPIVIALDCSRSMGFDGVKICETSVSQSNELPVSRLRYAACLAAALSSIGLRQGDRVGLALTSKDHQEYLPPGRGRERHRHLIERLERAKAVGSSNVAQLLTSIRSACREQGGVLIVLSDFLEPPDPVYAALSSFRGAGWRVLNAQLLTERELHLGGWESTRFVDPEGAGELIVDPGAIGEAYAREIHTWLADLSERSLRLGIEHRLITTELSPIRALEQLLRPTSVRSGTKQS